jgi:hypothetical protein
MNKLMNPPTSQTRRPKPGRRFFLFLGTLTILLSLPVFGLASCFFLSRQAKGLRDSVLRATGADWRTAIELNAGSLALALARTGLSFCDLPPEARTVLDSVRQAEVGLYQRPSGKGLLGRTNPLDAADQVMATQGWDRLVGVVNHQNLVAVYVPRKQDSESDVKICALVLDRRQMIVVSARADLGPLFELALNRPEWRQALSRRP